MTDTPQLKPRKRNSRRIAQRQREAVDAARAVKLTRLANGQLPDEGT